MSKQKGPQAECQECQLLKNRNAEIEAENKRLKIDNMKLNRMCLEWMDAGQHIFEKTGEFVNNANKGVIRQDAFNKLLTPIVLKLYSERSKRPAATEVIRTLKETCGDIIQEIDYEDGRYWIVDGKEGGYKIKSLGDRIKTILEQNNKI